MALIHDLISRLRRAIIFQWRLAKFRYYGFLILWHCAEYDWLSFAEILQLGYPVEETRVTLNLLCDMDLMEARMNLRDIRTYPREIESEVRRIVALTPVREVMEEMLEYRVVVRQPTPSASSELRALATLHA